MPPGACCKYSFSRRLCRYRNTLNDTTKDQSSIRRATQTGLSEDRQECQWQEFPHRSRQHKWPCHSQASGVVPVIRPSPMRTAEAYIFPSGPGFYMHIGQGVYNTYDDQAIAPWEYPSEKEWHCD